MAVNYVATYADPYQNIYGRFKTDGKKGTQKSEQNESVNKTNQKQEVKLSEKAQKYLEGLKKKYGNMDFYVGDYKTDEEASDIMSQGTKEYSVLIDPETLEKMATEDETRTKFESILNNAETNLEQLKGKLEEAGENVVSVGISVDKNGTVNYIAQVDKIREQQAERIAGKKEESMEQKRTEHSKKSRETIQVKANSIDKLLEKLADIRSRQEKETGARFDVTI